MGEVRVTNCEIRVTITNYEVRVTNSLDGSFSRQLELNNGRELHAAWPATSQEWITDAHVTRCGESQGTNVVPDRSQAWIRVWRSRIGDECRQDGTGKVRMIQKVKEFRSDLKIHMLRQGCILEEREIEFLEVRAKQ